MIGIYIEASHRKGLGHLFRCIHLSKYLRDKDDKYIILLSEHSKSLELLEENELNYELIDLSNVDGDWESIAIKKHGIDLWINDALDTELSHMKIIKRSCSSLVTFDDCGAGAELADMNIAPLCSNRKERLGGKNVLTDINCLILNPDIKKYRRIRDDVQNIVVSMGGSDTYNVTGRVVGILKKMDVGIDVHIGPAYEHRHELEGMLNDDVKIVDPVESLPRLFRNYDLAITGGGITPFEANAAGLPCVVIANEIFEIPVAERLEEYGTSWFLCYHEELSEVKLLDILRGDLDVKSRSHRGLQLFNLDALDRIYELLCDLKQL